MERFAGRHGSLAMPTCEDGRDRALRQQAGHVHRIGARPALPQRIACRLVQPLPIQAVVASQRRRCAEKKSPGKVSLPGLKSTTVE